MCNNIVRCENEQTENKQKSFCLFSLFLLFWRLGRHTATLFLDVKSNLLDFVLKNKKRGEKYGIC